MWRWIIRKLFGRRGASPSAARLNVRGYYDSARTTDDNRRHWSNADTLSAAAAALPDVRLKLRSRSRYERDNNGYAGGLVQTLANDLIGTGPTLQIENPDVKARWDEWFDASGLAETLHTGKQSKTTDGEVVLLLGTNPALATDVKLSVTAVEADRLAEPWRMTGVTSGSDGIYYDDYGNPTLYRILRYHPGDLLRGFPMDYDDYSAKVVIHWFRKDRPGQLRGVPELTASLPLFAQLRRWTLATLTAAETAADFAAVLETEASPDSETDDPNPFETLEIERGMMTSLPVGARLNQLKAEHPTAMYEGFKRELLKEIGRAVNAPYNVTAGDSSEYNYSSARLDHMLYRGALRVERNHCRRVVLEPIFTAWYREAAVAYRWDKATPKHSWYWPGFESIDPVKDANADSIRLANGTTTLAEIMAEYGQDWAEMVAQRAKEVEQMQTLGLIPEHLTVDMPADNQNSGNQQDGGDGTDGGDTVPQPAPRKGAAGNAAPLNIALNGAQVTALVTVLDKLALKLYPAVAVEAMVKAAFPDMDKALIAVFVRALANHVAPPPPQPAPAPASQPQPAPEPAQ